MNILFLMGVYPSYGGVEKVSTILANAFIERKYDVGIVSFEQPHPELATEELDEKVKLYKLAYPVYSKSNIRTLHSIICEGKYDFIINQWCVPYYVARLCTKAIKGTSCKLISVHHNLPSTNARIKAVEIDIEKGNGARIINWIKLKAITLVSRLSLRYTLNKSDKMLVLSPSFINVLSKFTLSKSSKIVCIPNSLTINGTDNINQLKKENEILYVGRIEYNQKRTYRLVDVWKKLESQFPDWKFTIVGDGPDATDLKNRIKSAGLKSMYVEGFKNPLTYYKRAKILTLVSEYEGFGLVIVEAMANGCVPIVLGSYSAVYDIIDDNCGIITTYPYKEDDLIIALKELMVSPDKTKKMGNNSIESSGKFALNAVVDKWIELFGQLS